jgi:rod shape-determining protein MreC
MRHIPVEPPAFFHRGPSPLTRLAFFVLISLSMLFLDTRYRYLENIRHVVAVVLYPLQRAAQMPGEALAFVGGYFATQRALSEENAALKRQLVEQGAMAQGAVSTSNENARLKALLDMRARYQGAATVVEVLYTGRDPFAQRIFVNKGADADLSPGDAVIDAQGVVGQVTRVLPFMAEVTLVTDKDHAVPVKVERSGVRSVLFGAGAGRLPELRFLSPNADIQQGDILVTSGIDGTYPPGLAVARVASLERETGQMFARITTQPLAGVDRSEYLLVLGHASAMPARPDEPADADAAKKPGKGRRRGG